MVMNVDGGSRNQAWISFDASLRSHQSSCVESLPDPLSKLKKPTVFVLTQAYKGYASRSKVFSTWLLMNQPRMGSKTAYVILPRKKARTGRTMRGWLVNQFQSLCVCSGGR